jgi:hypothetical protein
MISNSFFLLNHMKNQYQLPIVFDYNEDIKELKSA